MSWTTPTVRTTNELITSGIWNTDLVANLNELRGGGLAISGQASGHIPRASSSSQYVTSNALAFGGNGLLITPSPATGAAYFQGANNGGNAYVGLDNSTGGTFGLGNYVCTLYTDSASGISLAAANATGYLDVFTAGVSAGNRRLRVHASGGVSIGDTTDPGATNARVAGDAKFGTTSNFSWVSKTVNTVYQAASDGFMVGHGLASGGAGSSAIIAYTDASVTPSTIRQVVNGIPDTGRASVCCPVKKGDYYEIASTTTATFTVTCWWVPMGFNG
jgi:hypothetical protein